MIRRILLAAFLMTGAGALLLGATSATFVLGSGERVSGMLTYKGGGEVTLNVNGQARDYSWSEISLIAFVPGDPAAAELRQLPESSNPAELDSHMIVTRDGNVIHGKLHSFSSDGETVTYDPREGGAGARRNIASSQVARIYISAPRARSLYASVLNPPAAAPAAPAAAATGAVAITVNGNQTWTDTGMTVSQREQVSFSTSGEVTIASGAMASVDGTASFPGRASYPVPTAPGGALIGRIGGPIGGRMAGGTPFGIGSQSQITMPGSGRLYLGINDDAFNDNSGAFTVTMVR